MAINIILVIPCDLRMFLHDFFGNYFHFKHLRVLYEIVLAIHVVETFRKTILIPLYMCTQICFLFDVIDHFRLYSAFIFLVFSFYLTIMPCHEVSLRSLVTLSTMRVSGHGNEFLQERVLNRNHSLLP